MIGAKVNNRIASYDQVLRNGDIVEVLTSKSAKGPSRDWLNICRSNQARIKIKQWFKREKRDENIIRGKASFESELRRIGINPAIIAVRRGAAAGIKAGQLRLPGRYVRRHRFWRPHRRRRLWAAIRDELTKASQGNMTPKELL